nr:hypothetical protein [Tanacetum cinerariifolium]
MSLITRRVSTICDYRTRQSLGVLPSLFAVSKSMCHVTDVVHGSVYFATVSVSAVSEAGTPVHTLAHERSKAHGVLSGSTLSNEPKPLGQHRPPPPRSILSLGEYHLKNCLCRINPSIHNPIPYFFNTSVSHLRLNSIGKPIVYPSTLVELSPTSYLEPRVDKHNLLRGGCSDSGISSLRSTGGGGYKDGASGGNGNAAGAVHLARRSPAEGGKSEVSGDGDGVGMARSLLTSDSGGTDIEVCGQIVILAPVVAVSVEGGGMMGSVPSDPEEDLKEYEDDETEDGLVDHPMDEGDDGADDEDEDEEEQEEEHLAPADSTIVVPIDELAFSPERTDPIIPPPSTDTATTGARITIRPQTYISLPPEAEVKRLLAMPTPSPSPLTSLSPPSAEERLARCTTTAALPSPPLPPSLYPPPPVDRRDDILESEQPPRKRLCLSTLGSMYELRESSTRGYGIRDTWIDTVEAVLEMEPTTIENFNTRVTELVELHEHDTQDLYSLLEDAQDVTDSRDSSSNERHEMRDGRHAGPAVSTTWVAEESWTARRGC